MNRKEGNCCGISTGGAFCRRSAGRCHAAFRRDFAAAQRETIWERRYGDDAPRRSRSHPEQSRGGRARTRRRSSSPASSFGRPPHHQGRAGAEAGRAPGGMRPRSSTGCRAGEQVKLAHGLDHFDWDVAGASGDRCQLLHRAARRRAAEPRAARIYPVDSGTGQLAWSSPGSRVIVYEQTSARILTPRAYPRSVDLIVCDASFIARFPRYSGCRCASPVRTRGVGADQPQFEAGRGEVRKEGGARSGDPCARVPRG